MLVIGIILGSMVGIFAFVCLDEWYEYSLSGWMMDRLLRSRPVASYRAWRAMNDVMCDINMTLRKDIHDV